MVFVMAEVPGTLYFHVGRSEHPLQQNDKKNKKNKEDKKDKDPKARSTSKRDGDLALEDSLPKDSLPKDIRQPQAQERHRRSCKLYGRGLDDL